MTERAPEEREAIALCDMQGMMQSDNCFVPCSPLESIGD